MFERFTDEARQCVVHASQEARGAGDDTVGAAALLVGVAVAGGAGADALTACGLSAERLAQLRAAEGGAALDAEALGQIGIDVEAVRGAVESRFGRGAWSRRGGSKSGVSGHIPFTPVAKKSLELALREAIRLRDDHIGSGHLLLGVLRADDTEVRQMLAAADVSPDAVRAETLRRLSAAEEPRDADAMAMAAGMDHVAIQVADLPVSKAFYDAVLEPLGMRVLMEFGDVVGYGPADVASARPVFWLGPVNTPGAARELHLAFAAHDRAAVQAFRNAALVHGAQVLHEPREFPEYHAGYWASFVRDPDGNNVEAVFHQPGPGG